MLLRVTQLAVIFLLVLSTSCGARPIDSVILRHHTVYIGVPMHNFFDGEGYSLPQKNSQRDFEIAKPVYLSYEYGFLKSAIRLDFYNYYLLNPVLSYSEQDPPKYTRLSRAFTLFSFAWLQRVLNGGNNKLYYQIHFGGLVSYRYNGFDAIFLERVNPIEVRTDAIFYKRPGIGVLAEFRINYSRRIELNINANISRFFEPSHYYQNAITTEYEPNIFMSVIKIGLGYNFNISLKQNKR